MNFMRVRNFPSSGQRPFKHTGVLFVTYVPRCRYFNMTDTSHMPTCVRSIHAWAHCTADCWGHDASWWTSSETPSYYVELHQIEKKSNQRIATMNTLLIAVFAAFLIQIATSFAPQIRIRNCNAITKRTSSPFTVIYSSNGPPELQSNDEEPQVTAFEWLSHSTAWFDQFVCLRFAHERAVNSAEQWRRRWRENFRVKVVIPITPLVPF